MNLGKIASDFFRKTSRLTGPFASATKLFAEFIENNLKFEFLYSKLNLFKNYDT